MIGGVAQTIEYLPSKHESLSLNHSTAKKIIITNFTKSQLLSSCLLNILWQEMGNIRKALLLTAGLRWSSRKALMIELHIELATFFQGTPFLLERLLIFIQS
jgi:hypothetical protein